jgi:hypothetical protein
MKDVSSILRLVYAWENNTPPMSSKGQSPSEDVKASEILYLWACSFQLGATNEGGK